MTTNSRIDAETAEGIILWVLVDLDDSIGKVAPVVAPDWFSNRKYRLCYEVILELYKEGATLDSITLTAALESRGWTDAVRFVEIELDRYRGTVYHISKLDYYIDQLRSAYRARMLADACKEVAHLVENDSTPVVELVRRIESAIATTEPKTSNGLLPAKACLRDAYTAIMEPGSKKGLSTGFKGLDDYVCGFIPSHLVVLAGRPAMGKTALALCFAKAAMKAGKSVAMFSLEMSSTELLGRLIGLVARVSIRNIEKSDWAAIGQAAEWIGGKSLYIDDSGETTISSIRSEVKSVAKTTGVDLIIIDYIQLMAGNSAENREREVAEISRGLKIIAKEFDVPVIALSQLNRGIEHRVIKRPMLSDLRESGALEQDPDLVLMVHRQEYYERDNPDAKGKAEIIIAKNRHGPTGSVNLAWHADSMRFEDLATVADYREYDSWQDVY